MNAIQVELAEVRTEVRSSIGALQQSVKTLSDHVDGLFRRFDQMNRPNFALWISVMSLAATFFFGFWVVLGLKVNNETLPLKMSLLEVETQFNADAQLRNIQFAQQQRKNAELQNALHELGAKMPAYPDGPFYHPNISKTAGAVGE